MGHKSRTGEAGFTLMELLVVLFIVGLLAGLTAPSVRHALIRAREAALLENLTIMRRSIDDFYSDRLEYPEDLETLVEKRYLRFIPGDPVQPDLEPSWEMIFESGSGGMIDVRSTSIETGSNGKPYKEW